MDLLTLIVVVVLIVVAFACNAAYNPHPLAKSIVNVVLILLILVMIIDLLGYPIFRARVGQ